MYKMYDDILKQFVYRKLKLRLGKFIGNLILHILCGIVDILIALFCGNLITMGFPWWILFTEGIVGFIVFQSIFIFIGICLIPFCNKTHWGLSKIKREYVIKIKKSEKELDRYIENNMKDIQWKKDFYEALKYF